MDESQKTTRQGEGVPASEQTRSALVQSALDLFGDKGYDAASTRDIAGSARTNIASIAYHFGGKEGLRKACAQHVVNFVRALLTSASPGFYQAVDGQARTMQDAESEILAILSHLVRTVLVLPQARLIVRFVMREMANPSIVFDILYSGVFKPSHQRMCTLWATATGRDPDSEAVRISVFTVIGQIVYFRIGSQIVARRMAWEGYSAEEASRVADAIIANARAIIAAERNAMPTEINLSQGSREEQ
ncbi:MAG: CerR family C-terminal domain-containing protein [Rhizobiaceae bacterium]